MRRRSPPIRPNVPWAKFGCPDDDRHGWRRHLRRDAAGRRGRRAVDAEEQGGTGRLWRGLDAGRGDPQGALRQRSRRRRPSAGLCRSRPAAGKRGARPRAGGGRGAAGQQDARQFRVLPAPQGADRARHGAVARQAAHAGAGSAADQPAVARHRKAADRIRPSRSEGRRRPADRPVAAGAAGRRGVAGASHDLAVAEAAAGRAPRRQSVPVSAPKKTAADKSAPPPDLPPPSNRAIAPDVPAPPKRRLWVYARDPLQGNDMGFFDLNQVVLDGALGEGSEAGPGRRISRSGRRRSAGRLRLCAGRPQSSRPAGAERLQADAGQSAVPSADGLCRGHEDHRPFREGVGPRRAVGAASSPR